MIHIIDDYYVRIDENLNYTVLLDLHRVSVDKNGVETPMYKTIAYCGGTKQALRRIYKEICCSESKQQVIEIKEWIKIQNKVLDRFEEIIKDADGNLE